MLMPLLVAAVIRAAGVEWAMLIGLLCVLCCTALVVRSALPTGTAGVTLLAKRTGAARPV